jgi:hypothetical protein
MQTLSVESIARVELIEPLGKTTLSVSQFIFAFCYVNGHVHIIATEPDIRIKSFLFREFRSAVQKFPECRIIWKLITPLQAMWALALPPLTAHSVSPLFARYCCTWSRAVAQD